MNKFKKLIFTIIIFNKSLNPNAFVSVIVLYGRLEVVYLISTVGIYNMYAVFKSPQS